MLAFSDNMATMASRQHRTEKEFGEELRALLDQRGISLRKFAKAVGVPQPYLSRTLSGERPPSMKLLTGAADELGLRPDYFAEYRRQIVIEAIKADGKLRDRIYDQLRKSS